MSGGLFGCFEHYPNAEMSSQGVEMTHDSRLNQLGERLFIISGSNNEVMVNRSVLAGGLEHQIYPTIGAPTQTRKTSDAV